jgi:hypothetical protein
MRRMVKPSGVSRLGRAFGLSRTSRNLETVPPQQPTSLPPGTPVVFGRGQISIARVREAPAAAVELDDRIQALVSVVEVAEVSAFWSSGYAQRLLAMSRNRSGKGEHRQQELLSFYEDLLANPFAEEGADCASTRSRSLRHEGPKTQPLSKHCTSASMLRMSPRHRSVRT